MTAEPILQAIITAHGVSEMSRRGLSEDIVRQVLVPPEQRCPLREGRVVLQSRVTMGEPPRAYLVRVFVDVDRSPPEVVTAYRTSKLTKYWRQDT